VEERYAHLQRHVVQQDKAMLELSEDLAKLRQELARLRAAHGGAAATGEHEAADERPPHY
jgi:uncharacterized coiled-coil protein SlyX